MFIDTTRIHLKAGDGGKGCESFNRTKFNRRGSPDGGMGGNGGDIKIIADRNIQTLLDFKYRQHFKADRGRNGSSNNKNGPCGKDTIIHVPPGTVILDNETNEVLRDLSEDSQSVTVAKGGTGGRGNSRFRHANPGEPGEERTVRLELRLIADVGIIGFPNAGKSTLISKISNTRPKIASYPFTTKEPTLGVVKTKTQDIVVADIPGLIKGAHRGRGLGHQFLRHVERTKLLLHLVDIAAVDGRDPINDYNDINEELALYSRRLKRKKQIIACNKIDLPQAQENLERFASKLQQKVYPISALNRQGLEQLVSAIEEAMI